MQVEGKCTGPGVFTGTHSDEERPAHLGSRPDNANNQLIGWKPWKAWLVKWLSWCQRMEASQRVIRWHVIHLPKSRRRLHAEDRVHRLTCHHQRLAISRTMNTRINWGKQYEERNEEATIRSTDLLHLVALIAEISQLIFLPKSLSGTDENKIM